MARLTVNANIAKGKIDRNLYGHFAEHLGRCVHEGIYVGEDSPVPNVEGMRKDVIEALRELKVPVLRWPGGCFADAYLWKDGVGPKESRKRMVNVHWGGVEENNHFGTHEFLRFCELIGAEPYIAGNVGSGTVREMAEWVEYMTFGGESPMANWRRENGRDEPWKIKYFGVGNENWGCGGDMRPEYYSDLYRHYASYVRSFGDNKVFKIACGASDEDYNWTDTVMRMAAKYMDGISLHYYTLPTGEWKDKGSATDFDERAWFDTFKRTIRIDGIIAKHAEIMDRYDPDKRIALLVDEWGTWYNVEPGTNPGFLYQQNTMRDALVAGLNLNIFHKHNERVKMANIAQLANVLQAVILTEGDKLVLTPTYHAMRMYNVHQDAMLLDFELSSPAYESGGDSLDQIGATVSADEEGRIHVSLCNLHPSDSAEIRIDVRGRSAQTVQGTMLTAGEMNAHNTFEEPNAVAPKAFTDFRFEGGELVASLPAMSIVALEVR